MNEKHCKDCSKKFEFPIRRGRRPERCPDCREKVKNAFRAKKAEEGN